MSASVVFASPPPGAVCVTVADGARAGCGKVGVEGVVGSAPGRGDRWSPRASEQRPGTWSVSVRGTGRSFTGSTSTYDPSSSIVYVCTALLKIFKFFVLVFRFLCQTRNTHGAKRPVLRCPLSSRRCVFVGVFPLFYVSLVAMLFTWDASCLTEPEPTRLQGSPKTGLSQFGGARS